jgi:hypothetical protein
MVSPLKSSSGVGVESKNVLSRIDDLDKALANVISEFTELRNKLTPVLKSPLINGETCTDSVGEYFVGRSPSDVSVKIENITQAITDLQLEIQETRLRVDV